ncbi:hypothetical protein G9A89_009132, partial [Geosiphon pyriformis]
MPDFSKGLVYLPEDEYVKEMVKRDLKPIPSTIPTRIYPGAVYTSRLLTAQVVDFSKELVYLPK